MINDDTIEGTDMVNSSVNNILVQSEFVDTMHLYGLLRK